ncbi:hypothetical protein [Streptomyces sp. NPDC051219]
MSKTTWILLWWRLRRWSAALLYGTEARRPGTTTIAADPHGPHHHS